MTTTPEDEPWGRYHRMRVHAGWSYPLAQVDVKRALELANVSVDEVVLFHAPSAKERADAKVGTMAVVSAKWDGRSSALWVHAVPGARRAAARTVALGEALPAAVRWLKSLAERGNAWKATRHEWKSRLEAASLVIDEVDAEYPAAGSAIGGW